MSNYPKPDEKVSARDIGRAAEQIESKAKSCMGALDAARVSFQREKEILLQEGSKNFNTLAKTVLRLAGKLEESEIDGPGWARLDALCAGRLGVSSQASSDRIEREEAKAHAATLESFEAERSTQMQAAESRHEELRKEAIASREAWTNASLTRRELAPLLNLVFLGKGCAKDAAEAEKLFGSSSWWSKTFGTQTHARHEAWAKLRSSGVDVDGVDDVVTAAERHARQAERLLAECEKEREAHVAWFRRLREARMAQKKPSKWLDAGSKVSARSMLELATKQGLESALGAMASKAPTARICGRSALRAALGVQAMDLSEQALGEERVGLSKIQTNMSGMASKMSSAARKSSSSKASVRFDMKELAERLDKRTAELKEIAVEGPRRVNERMEALDWDNMGSLGADHYAEWASAAKKVFGADSAPAKAFASAHQRAGSLGQASTVSSVSEHETSNAASTAMFWYVMMLSDGAYGKASSEGLIAGPVDSGFDFGAGALSTSMDTSAVDLAASSDSSSWSSDSSSSSSSYSSCSSSSSSSSSSCSSCSSSSSSSCSSSSCSSGSSCSS
jgi:hypothetical protein